MSKVNQMLDLASNELDRGQRFILVALALPSATTEEKEERDLRITLALGRANEIQSFLSRIITAVKKELKEAK